MSTPYVKYGRFSQAEDRILSDMVARMGAHHWNMIAMALPGRTARQCRDRFQNYLMPGINHSAWTKEEDKLLKEKFKEYGPKWSVIARFFERRSTNCLKNHWNYARSRKSKSKEPAEPPPSREGEAKGEKPEATSLFTEEIHSVFSTEWDEFALMIEAEPCGNSM